MSSERCEQPIDHRAMLLQGKDIAYNKNMLEMC